MEERNLNEGLKQEVNKLKTQVQRLNNIVWVVGIVAVIFGISGGWGYNTLSKAQNKLKDFEKEVNQQFSRFQDKANAHFDDKKKDLEKFINDKKNELDDKYVKYNVNVAFRLSDYRNILLSGGGEVRTRTDKIGPDETWKIEKAP